MKKLYKIFSFLSKKGCFVLGVAIGLLLALFCSSALTVHAEELEDDAEDSTSAGYKTVLTANYCNGKRQRVVIASDAGLEDFAYCYSTTKYTCSCGEALYDVACVSKYDMAYWYDGETEPRDTDLALGVNFAKVGYAYCHDYELIGYLFSTEDEAKAYLNGELDASAALNYEEIMNAQEGIFSDAIPSASNFELKNLSSSHVSGVVEFATTDLPLRYDLQVEHYYVSASWLEAMSIDGNLVSGGSLGYLGQLVTGYTEDSLGLLHCSTVADTINMTDQDVGMRLMRSNTIDRFDDTVSSISVFECVPPVYEDLSVSEMWLFGVLAKEINSDDLIYIGSQATLVPYYYDESGVKYVGRTQVVRRFVYSNINNMLGSQGVIIATDSEGNQYIDSSYDLDINGDVISSDSLTSDNLLEYIENGFGLLGKDGYIVLLQKTFLGVPSYIWGLVAAAMAVSIIVVIFKALRGM